MRRGGFTMVELIFVIVILGILAAVAIPRLAATRDDAKISQIASNIAAAKNEIASYYTAKGTTDPRGENMSNVIAEGVAKGDVDTTTDNQAVFKAGNINDCVTLSWDNTQITVSHGNANGDPVCTGVQSIAKAGSITIGGSQVTY